MVKIIIGIVAAIVVIVVGQWILPVQRAAIEVAAEPIGLPAPFTNAFVTSILLSIVILIVAFVVGRGLKETPGGLQNIVQVDRCTDPG